MKTLLVVLDGIGDLPCKALGGKTPLEAARTPYLDKIAERSTLGTTMIAGGIAPESDVGVFAVLGHDSLKKPVGRGLPEAIGAGMKFKDGMLALRANFSTCKGRRIIDRRVGRNLSEKEAGELAKEINEKVKLESAGFEFKNTVAYRGVLILKSKRKLSKKVSNTDPAYVVTESGVSEAKAVFENKITKCRALKKGARESAGLVNEFTEKAIQELEKSKLNERRKKKGLLPANCVLLRDAEDAYPKGLESFKKKWAFIADMPCEIGIAKLMGMKMVPVSRGNEARNFEERAKLCLKAVKENEGVYVHLKGPDLFGHDGDAVGKTKCVELIDKHFFKYLQDFKGKIIVTGDHFTPCELKAHSGDPVPTLITADAQRKGRRYFEKNCKDFHIKAVELLKKTSKIKGIAVSY